MQLNTTTFPQRLRNSKHTVSFPDSCLIPNLMQLRAQPSERCLSLANNLVGRKMGRRDNTLRADGRIPRDLY